MKHRIHSFNLWRLKRMMLKSFRLDAKIERLGKSIERWEKENVKLNRTSP